MLLFFCEISVISFIFREIKGTSDIILKSADWKNNRYVSLMHINASISLFSITDLFTSKLLFFIITKYESEKL
ncbi:hypothetical protein [Acidiplasma cupricumulans]|uniref:hypothetical protein n=1 Tax=Acidiplasma cupricumulans TaxID=312540 RepID=UPI0015855AE5|nr:hypothetical protein [Acidiplasma cupricumulans]